MPQIIVVFRARARQIDETYMATALKQPVGLKPNRREVMGERGQMCAHSRRKLRLKREGARIFTAVPTPQQIRAKSAEDI